MNTSILIKKTLTNVKPCLLSVLCVLLPTSDESVLTFKKFIFILYRSCESLVIRNIMSTNANFVGVVCTFVVITSYSLRLSEVAVGRLFLTLINSLQRHLVFQGVRHEIIHNSFRRV